MKVVKTFRFSEADLAVLDALGEQLGGHETETLRAIVADGLRYRMEHNEPAVHPHFLDPLVPEAVVEEFLHFLDAVRDQGGLKGLDGKPSNYYFAKAPKGGRWEEEGVAGGWAVLDRKTRFTKNGYEQVI